MEVRDLIKLKMEKMKPITKRNLGYKAHNTYFMCYYPINQMWCMALYNMDKNQFKPCIKMAGNPTHYMPLPAKPTKQTIEDFIKINYNDMSVRLANVLMSTKHYFLSSQPEERYFTYVEDITKREFMRTRNAGKKTWLELETLLKKNKLPIK